ncbi:MAG: N-acetylmuramic acid 6-phosphate etherase [Gemmatimonadales bacterium]
MAHAESGSPLRLTERRNPRSADIDTADSQTLVDLINAEDATVPGIVAAARVEIARAVDLIERSFRAGGRLLYVGAGTSGRLGVLDASECPPTFGTPPELVLGIIAGGLPALVKPAEGAEDDLDAGIAAIDARDVTPNDTVVGIAASGGTPYVRAALGRAQTRGAATVLVACAEPPAVLRETCDVCIVLLTGPEVVTGSTRMKAGTATKLVLNTLTTASMIRLGKTYGNLMVDLQAWSQKLVDRGERIVMEVTGGTREEARSAIAAADGSVRTAIVMVRLGVDAAAARERLARHDNRVRAVLGDPPAVRA